MQNKIKHQYGLIGRSLKHSFSASYFSNKFKQEDIQNAAYSNFELEKIEDFTVLILNNKNLKGLNVTIPYKKQVIDFLDDLSNVPKELQAVNCIAFSNNKLIGHNTDVIGFENSLKPLLKAYHKKALILGTGGAAQAVAYVLKKLQIEFEFVSTQNDNEYLSYSEVENCLSDFKLIINTTPVGMYPNINESPLNNMNGIGKEHLVYDLIYNPEETLLLKEAKQQGAQIKNGLEMLEIQAEESWKIWNNLD